MKCQFQKIRTAGTSCMHLPPLNFKTAIHGQPSTLLTFKQISSLLAKVNILHSTLDFVRYAHSCTLCAHKVSTLKKSQDVFHFWNSTWISHALKYHNRNTLRFYIFKFFTVKSLPSVLFLPAELVQTWTMNDHSFPFGSYVLSSWTNSFI